MSSQLLRRFVLLPLIALSLTLSVGVNNLRALSQSPQDGPDFSMPPRVIDVYPDPNTELTGTDPITVSFDQPMDQPGVLQALRLDPYVQGNWNWDDAETVTFTPAQGWPQDKSYKVMVNVQASSRQHKQMAAPFSVSVKTQGPLKVVQYRFNSSGNAKLYGVDNVQFVIGFNRPMALMDNYEALLKVPTPITITPDVPGKGVWITPAQYLFSFSEPLIHSSTYTVTTISDLKAADGATAAKAFTWSFTTPDPQVYSGSDDMPEYVVDGKNPPRLTAPNVPITVHFGQPMDQESMKASFSVVGPNGPVDGTLSAVDSSTITFTPKAMWERNTSYTYTISTAAVTLNGKKPLKKGLKRVFRIIDTPRITSSMPLNGQYYDTVSNNDLTLIQLIANLPFATNQDFANALSITDASGNTIPIVDNKVYVDSDRTDQNRQFNYGDVLSFSVKDLMQSPPSDYTVSLKAGLVDQWGMPIAPYTFTFTNRPERRPTPTKTPTPNPKATVTPTPVPVTRADFPTQMGLVPILTNDVAITNLSRATTFIPVQIGFDRPVIMSLYRLESSQFNVTLLLSSQYACFDYYYGYGSQSCSPRGLDQDGNKAWEKRREPYRGKLPNGIAPSQRIRQWTVNHPSDEVTPGEGDQPLSYLPVTTADGKKLTPGLYWITLQDPDFDPIGYQFPLVVASANLTLKRGPNDTLVWATNIQSAQPIADTTITLLAESGQVVATGQTDAKGVFHISLDSTQVPPASQLMAIAQSEGQFGLWYNDSTYAQRREQYYIYTDRQLYRPGEKVRMRGMVRVPQDMTYSLPSDVANRKINVCVRSYDQTYDYYGDYTPDPYYLGDPNANPDSKVIYSEDLPVNEWGSFSAEFTLPATLDASRFYVQVDCKTQPALRADFEPKSTANGNSYYDEYYYSSSRSNWNYRPAVTSFRVESFRTPEFTVKVTDVPSEYIVGQHPYTATIQANYYAGPPLTSAKVDWQIIGTQTSFNYTGPGYYHFNDCYGNGWEYTISPKASGEGEIDAQGRLGISTDLNNFGNCPMLAHTEVRVSDLTDQVSSAASTTTLIHGSNLYVGAMPADYAPIAGKPTTVKLISVAPDSKPLAGQKLTVTIHEEQLPNPGEFYAPPLEIASVDITTDANGRYDYSFVPTKGTRYIVTVTGNKRIENDGSDSQQAVMSTVYVYARPASTKEAPSWSQTVTCSGQSFDLQADKDHYKPGDTAQILIALPGSGSKSVLLTTERGGILSYDLIRTSEPSILYNLPITNALAPNVYVSATMLSEIDPATNRAVERTASVGLSVDLQDQLLKVELSADRNEYRPGDDAEFTVKVTDSKNNPVQAEVGLKLVDQAVLDLVPDTQLSLQEAFYKDQLSHVTTVLSLSAIIDPNVPPQAYPGGGCGGGGGGGGGADMPFDLAVPIRDDYETTPLWAPHVVTGKDGTAVVKMRLPANLTAWQLDARAITKEAYVGQQRLSITSNMPLSVRPVVPRFFVTGDKTQVAAIVSNATNSAQTVMVTLQASGLQISEPLTKQIQLAANERTRVTWSATVLEASPDGKGADLTFIVKGNDGFQDAAKPPLATGPGNTIPIRAYLAPDMIGRAGALVGQMARVEGLRLPKRYVSGLGSLSVDLDYTLAGSTTKSLDYLRQYPYYCMEQTVSTFLPNTVTLKTLTTLGLSSRDLEANLRTAMEAAQKKIKDERREDGGWGWYRGMDSNPTVTAYVALGLIEAQAAGQTIDRDSLERALTFIATDARNTSPRSKTTWEYNSQLNRAAFSFYVLSRVKRAQIGDLDRLLELRHQLTYAGQGFLLMAYEQQFPDNPAVHVLATELTTAATAGTDGRYWTEPYQDYFNWGSDIRTTGIVVTALAQLDVKNPILPDAVRYLIASRIGDHWATTQDTVWSVLGLTQWMAATGELKPSFSYQVRLNGKDMGSSTVAPENMWQGKRLEWSVTELLRDQVNRVALNRSAGDGVLYYSEQLQVQLPAESVLPVQRGLFVSRRFVSPSDPFTPISSATVGDLVIAEMTVVVPDTVYFAAIEDSFPAGLEPVNLDLENNQADSELKKLRVWGYDVDELRDDRAVVYAETLYPGTYTFQYVLRATTPGDYRVLPMQGYSFYSPGIFGRSSGSVFSVKERAN